MELPLLSKSASQPRSASCARKWTQPTSSSLPRPKNYPNTLFRVVRPLIARGDCHAPAIASKIGTQKISDLILSVDFSNEGSGILCSLLEPRADCRCWSTSGVLTGNDWLVSVAGSSSWVSVTFLFAISASQELCERSSDVLVERLTRRSFFSS